MPLMKDINEFNEFIGSQYIVVKEALDNYYHYVYSDGEYNETREKVIYVSFALYIVRINFDWRQLCESITLYEIKNIRTI